MSTPAAPRSPSRIKQAVESANDENKSGDGANCSHAADAGCLAGTTIKTELESKLNRVQRDQEAILMESAASSLPRLIFKNQLIVEQPEQAPLSPKSLDNMPSDKTTFVGGWYSILLSFYFIHN